MSRFLFFLVLINASFYVAAGSELQQHPSPYVRLHANDAVQWQVWDERVLKRAQKENKLIFISVGYYACHWCHVMRDESFNDPVIGQLVNQGFIPVKVDRELNPALDAYLMDFVQKTRGYGGWPLNVFLTPQGYPLVGMVYLPSDDFKQFISKLDNQWQGNENKLKQLAMRAFEFSQALSQQRQPQPELDQLLDDLQLHVQGAADDMQGGIGLQTKFPRPALLLTLMDWYQQKPQAWLKAFLRLTLQQMASNGLHDVIGGGFFRYTTDPGWQVPHFEKMLYTNAALIQVYLKAYQLFGDPLYRHIAIETAEFLIRDMRATNGGFISALNAQDASGIEGGGYIWRAGEMAKYLTAKQRRQVIQQWRFVDMPESTGLLPVGVAIGGPAIGNEWPVIQQRLMAKRRVSPVGRDNKVLPAWNAYVLSSLAAVVQVSDRDDIKQVAEALNAYLVTRVQQGLKRTVGNRSWRYLEDYALVAQGLLDWQDARQSPPRSTSGQLARSEANNMTSNMTKDMVKQMIGEAIDLFSTDQGWRLSDQQLLPRPGDYVNIADAQLPAAEVVIYRMAQRMGIQNSEPIGQKLSQLRKSVSENLLQNPLQYASYIQFRLLEKP